MQFYVVNYFVCTPQLRYKCRGGKFKLICAQGVAWMKADKGDGGVSLVMPGRLFLEREEECLTQVRKVTRHNISQRAKVISTHHNKGQCECEYACTSPCK